MKPLYYLLSGLVGVVCFSSCNTTMYVSNAVNAPVLREKGEVKVAVTQNDLQAAVGAGNNFGIIANGYYQNYKGSNNYEHGGGYGELGMGFFTNTEDDNHLFFEAYGGAGYGIVRKQEMFRDQFDNSYMARFEAQAGKIFLQPDFAFSNRYLDVILTPKFSFVKYTDFTQVNYPEQELRDDYLDNDNLTGPVFIFAEPALTVRGGYKFIKLQAQFGLTLNMTGSNIRHPSNFSSLGLVIDIARWYRD
jgi:hypothetical protein